MNVHECAKKMIAKKEGTLVTPKALGTLYDYEQNLFCHNDWDHNDCS